MRPPQITSARALTTWLIRAAALALVSAGSYLVLKKALFAVGTGVVPIFMSVYEGVGEEHSTYRGAAMLVVGIALALLSRRLAHWVVAMPPNGCPRCGYEGLDGTMNRCPECGLDGFTPAA
ncbi:MAG: hypothetical protein KF745_05705 [Phycisphaeraceae bacterium]|nr:hypothetical protein [Phycisphaeraceae bacterium]